MEENYIGTRVAICTILLRS